MPSPISPKLPDSPMLNCFCGFLASPCRDNKYCSEQCAREDTKKMLMGEPSHYRNISQAEVLEKLGQSGSPCRLAKKILVRVDITTGDEYEQRDESKPLPPLPSSSQLPTPQPLANIKNTFDSIRQGDAILPRQKRLHSSILARRTGQRVV